MKQRLTREEIAAALPTLNYLGRFPSRRIGNPRMKIILQKIVDEMTTQNCSENMSVIAWCEKNSVGPLSARFNGTL